MDYRSTNGRLENKCKECRKKQDRARPSKTYDVQNDGHKTCQDCGTLKHVSEFGVNKAVKGGRKPICKPCEYLTINSERREDGPIYKPMCISEFIPESTQYKMGECEVCCAAYSMVRKSHKRCEQCTLLVRDIYPLLTQKRNGKTVAIDTSSTKVSLAVGIAKLFCASQACAYCARPFTDDNPRHIDHTFPISLGGIHSLSNFTICCMECNFSKNRARLNDWLIVCKLVSDRAIEVIEGALQNQSPSSQTPSLFVKTCQVCMADIDGLHHLRKNCVQCHDLVRKLNSSLTSSRNGQSLKCNAQVITGVAQKWLNTMSCCYCDRSFTDTLPKSIDHILPVCLGGTNVLNNLAVCCLECNRAKSMLGLARWVELCQAITNNRLDLTNHE